MKKPVLHKNLKLEAALDYQSKGFSVIPVGADKKPLIAWKEYQNRKASPTEIKEWFEKYPTRNIAIVTGKISGIVVVDIEKGGNSDGYPPTVTAKSGGGGVHLLYKHPGDEIPNGTRVRELTDIRGDGGYILVAPSVSDKGEYKWITSPDDSDFSEMPDWLKKLTTNTASDKKWLSAKDGVSEGSRNDTAASMAGKILSSTDPELWEGIGWEQLQIWNNKNTPPLPEAEIRSVWESIKKYHVGGMPKDFFVNQCDPLLSEIPKNTPKESILKVLTPLLEILANNTSPEEAEIYVRNKVKTELDIKTKDMDAIVKHFKKMRISVMAKAEEAKKKAKQLAADPPLTVEETRAAEQILKTPTLLYDILKMVKKLGVVGEEKNILLHYIILTSRQLKQPLSATVKGDSSSGKSYTLLTTIKLCPKSAYIDLTDATAQSFYYCPEDHFKHKIIVIFEKHGGERADYAIRTLQSEGKLKIQVTVKNPETGQFETQTIEKEGPTGFVTTTTASVIHSENDTRNISMFPDQSSEQTSRVYESVDSRYLGIQPVSDDELKPWRHAQLCLERLPVYIPFAKSFRKYFPNHIVRTRRDYGHFLAIVETVAFLHQKQREIIELHGQRYIRATIADAYVAKVIVESSLSKSMYELPEKTIEAIKMAGVLIEELKEESGEDDGKKTTFTITMLAKRLGWDRDTVAKWMKPASKKGYLTVVVDAKGPKGAEYKLEEKDLPGDRFLPSIDDLVADNPDENTENIYDPLTGEIVAPGLKPEISSTDAPTDLEEQQNEVCAQDTAVNPIGASVENTKISNNTVPIPPEEAPF